METVSVPSSETNDNHIVKLEDLLSKKTNKAKYFQEYCNKFEGKVQITVKVSGVKRYYPGEEQA